MLLRSIVLNKKTRYCGVLLLLLICIGINIWRVMDGLYSGVVLFDAKQFYLPMASQLMEQGLDFFLDKRSLIYPPMAYIYPALLGADAFSVKLLNVITSCIVLLLVFDSCRLLHSLWAGLMAACLYAGSPLIQPLIPTVVTEPPYFFLTTVWMWCVIRILTASAQKRWFILGGIAFGVSILTRMNYLYFLYATIPVCLVGLYLQQQDRKLWVSLLKMHLLALVIVLVPFIKNYLVFDHWVVAWGTGNALYLGSHPLTLGYAAPYLGLMYDDGSVLQGLDRLGFAGDALLKATAFEILKDRDFFSLSHQYGQKILAFLFFTDVDSHVSNAQKSFRLVEVAISLIGLFFLRLRYSCLFLGFITLYQTVAHMPLLYVHRYTIGAIEIPLLILSAVGCGAILKGIFNTVQSGENKGTGLILLAVSLGAVTVLSMAVKSAQSVIQPNIFEVPHTKRYYLKQPDLATQSRTIIRPDGLQTLSITIQGYEHQQGSNTVLSMHLAAKLLSSDCDTLMLDWLANEDGAQRMHRQLRIHKHGELNWVHIGVVDQFRIEGNGTLELSSPCMQQVIVDELIFSVDHTGSYYRQKALGLR